MMCVLDEASCSVILISLDKLIKQGSDIIRLEFKFSTSSAVWKMDSRPMDGSQSCNMDGKSIKRNNILGATLKNGLLLPRFIQRVIVNVSGKQSMKEMTTGKRNT